MKLIAIIDIGSHSTKLEIFKVKGKHKVKRVIKENDYLHIFKDLLDSSTISEETVKRLTNILSKYKKIIANYECDTVKTIATSALRDAANSSDIVSFIKEQLDLDIEVISGEQEAEYSQLAFLSLNIKSSFATIFDLGGGSTEVSFFNNNEPISYHSFNIGVIRCVSDRNDEEWSLLSEFVKAARKPDALCIGLGSSVRRFACMLKQKKHKKGYVIKKDDVTLFNKILVAKGTDYIQKKYNLHELDPRFLKTIVGLLFFFYETLNVTEIYYYPISIRLGIALSILNNSK